MQKVVTSYTTSEPQTVHFGMPTSQPGLMQRSEALSHLKTHTTASSGGYSNMSVPPPPSATQHWNNNNTASSLVSGMWGVMCPFLVYILTVIYLLYDLFVAGLDI